MDMANEQVRLIVCDIGGVLIKTDEAILFAIEDAARRLGLGGGCLDNVYSVFGMSLEDYVRAYLPPEHKASARKCYDAFGEIYPTKVRHLLKPYAGVDEALHQLKEQGMLVATFSCMNGGQVDANLSLLSFRDFDAVFAIDDYGENHKRPDPRGLQMLMGKLGCSAQETAYVGDTEMDILMARNAGVVSVGVTSGAQPTAFMQRAAPNYTIGLFRDILSLLPL